MIQIEKVMKGERFSHSLLRGRGITLLTRLPLRASKIEVVCPPGALTILAG